MAESKTINTRLVLRNDTLANWEGSNKVLLKGEAALAFDGSEVKMLIGDGTKTWSQLSGDASTIGNIRFKTGNIIGLEDYVSNKETNTTYQLVSADLETGETGKSYKLQKQEKGETTWTDVTGSRFNIPQFDPSTLQGEIDALSVQVSSFSNDWKTGVDTAIDTTLPGQISQSLTDAKAYTDEVSTALSTDYVGKITDLSTAVKTDFVKYTDVQGGAAVLTGDNKIATMADIVGLSGSVHILGTIENDPETTLSTDQQVIVATYPNAKRGAIVINTTNGKEYVCMAEIGVTAVASDWIEIGDEKIYATKAALELSVTNLNTAIATEKTRAEGVEGGLRTDVNAVSTDLGTEVTNRKAADDALSVDYVSKIGTAKTEAMAYTDTVSAWLSGDYYTQIQAEKTRAEGVEGGLRTDLNTVSGDLDTLEGTALTSVVINGISADLTTANVAEFNFGIISCGGAS